MCIFHRSYFASNCNFFMINPTYLQPKIDNINVSFYIVNVCYDYCVSWCGVQISKSATKDRYLFLLSDVIFSAKRK